MTVGNDRRRETHLLANDYVAACKAIGERSGVQLIAGRVLIDGVAISQTALRRLLAEKRRAAKTLASRGPTAKDIMAVLNEPEVHAKIMKDLGINA